MEELTLDLPAMYGDHHVSEVRRILLEMPGVEDVYASSCFQVVVVKYDPARVSADAITVRLGQAGYLGDLAVPLEMGDAASSPSAKQAEFRHTASYKETGQVIGFGQNVRHGSRTLWPCPGMGTLEMSEETDGKERA